jgi:hypothetical protein
VRPRALRAPAVVPDGPAAVGVGDRAGFAGHLHLGVARVRSIAAVGHVRPTVTDEHVVTGAPGQRVGAAPARDRVGDRRRR